MRVRVALLALALAACDAALGGGNRSPRDDGGTGDGGAPDATIDVGPDADGDGIGDARYGHAPTNKHFFEKHGLDRAFLHCSRIALVHPLTGASLECESALPGDLRSVLASVTHAT